PPSTLVSQEAQAAAARRHPQAQRQSQSPQGGAAPRHASSEGGPPARQHVTPGHVTVGENPVNRGDRGAQRGWHAQEPPPCTSDRGCGLLRVSATTGLQGGVVWLPGDYGQSLGALLEDVFGMRLGGRGADAGRPYISV